MNSHDCIETIKKTPLLNLLVRRMLSLAGAARRLQLERAISEIPKVKLGKENIGNTRVLLDREELLEFLPKNGVVAELGVDKGDFSELILRNNKPKKLHLVDIWGTERYGEDKAKLVQEKYGEEIASERVGITRKLSLEGAEEFKDGYFDWIYIDTDHSYTTTIQELYAWAPKVKDGGYMAGHDYTMGNFSEGYKYGVIEAVAEFCVKESWQIAFLTADFTEVNSFAIKRL